MRRVSTGGLALLGLGVLLVSACGDGTPGPGETTPPSTADADNDGFTADAGDCDDNDAAVNIAAPEICDAKDNDCDGATDENADVDGDGQTSAELCDDGQDCDDNDGAVYLGAAEACDAKDNDCDGATDEAFDSDGDGQASAATCASGTDCNDADAAVYVGATELCDGKDNNCDTSIDEGFDADNDGFTAASLCDAGTDCNDSNADIYPGAQEILDGLDNDCKDGIEKTAYELNYADLRLNPPAGYTLNNRSLAFVGDLNNDGFDDALVGLPRKASDPQYRGAAFIVFGREIVAPPSQVNMDTTGFLLAGVDAGENAGYATTRAGDLNGDGFDDLVLTGPKRKAGVLANAGAVYILFGKAQGWANGQSLDTADVVIFGSFTGEELGSDVAGLGDVNGDGLADLLVGAQASLANPSNRIGRAYLLLGRRSGWENVVATANFDASWLGESNNSLTGAYVGGPGDVNGDGLDDILIGAPGMSDGGPNSGKTYLLFGQASPSWGTDFELRLANVKLNGAQNDGALPVGGVTITPSIQGLGDVDDDGFADFAVSAPSAAGGTGGLVNNGKVYLIYGRGTWTATMSLTEASGALFAGEVNGDQLGSDLNGLGDVNQDGIDDLILSAPSSDSGVAGSQAGQSYVLLGQTNRADWASGGLFFTDVMLFGGTTGKLSTGASLAGRGDFNGDGWNDFGLASEDGTLFVVTDFAY